MPFDGPDGYAAGIESLARLIEPRERLSVADWAARYRVLSAKASSQPGPWRNERFPYTVEIMNALDWRHPAPVVVVVKSAQSGVSDAVLNWLGRGMHYEPASFLSLWPSDDVGATWSRSRVQPMIDAVPALARMLSSGRRTTGNTLLEKHYPQGVLFIGSAGKPNDVATVSVPNLILDDADRMPKELKDEGDPFELALMRSITFPRRKAVIVSTPTTEENSRVWPWWLQSTMDRFYLPCTHCGHMQHLRFAQLKWARGHPEQAQYACEECAALIEERHKTDMLLAGEWRATHPEREGSVKGFHVNGLYGPLGQSDPWAKHAAAWERAQGSSRRIQVFFNTRLGEVHKGERKKVLWDDLKRRAEPYELRTVPRGTLLLTSGTDVQADRVETQVLGFGRATGGRLAISVIDYAVHYGDPMRPEVWAALDDYIAGEIDNACGVRMRIACAMVDAGYLPTEVMNFTRSRRARGIYACRGSTNPTRLPIGKPAYPDVKGRAKAKMDQRGAERYEIGVSELKHWLFERLRADAGEPDKPVLPADRHIRFSADLQDEYYRQLTAETYDPKEGWIARANYHRNEALDTFNYAIAAAMHHSVAVHKMREADWQRLEQLYEPKDAKPQAPAPLGKSALETLGGFLPIAANPIRSE